MNMRPEYSCTLLEALPRPPWKQKQDWSLYITWGWEKRIPFSVYVLPSTSTSADDLLVGQTSSFSKFSTLPAELQLHILGFCSASTLFQLMHVSSALRAEASKLFWANIHAYFLVNAEWLLDGGYPGYQCCDGAFLQYVQNVEIEYAPSTNNDICSRSGESMNVRHDRIQVFWYNVQRRFPQVKNIVINQNGESSIWGGAEAVPRPLQTLVQACPTSIQVSVYVSERQSLGSANNTSTASLLPTQKWRRSGYQLTADNIWTKLGSRQSQTILLPMKRFSGLVDEFGWLRCRCLRIELQQYGLWPLAIEALDQHHFGNGKNDPFSCPWPACHTQFGNAGEWTMHAGELHYTHLIDFRILPDEIRKQLEKRVKALRKSYGEAGMRFREIQKVWHDAGKEKQREIERVWIEQLENMWGTETGAGGSKLWSDFIEWMGTT